MPSAIITFQSEPEWLIRICIPGFIDEESAREFAETCSLDTEDGKLVLRSDENTETIELRQQIIPERKLNPPTNGLIYLSDGEFDIVTAPVGNFTIIPGLFAPYQKLGTDIETE